MVASNEILKQTSDQYRRIRNTFRFILGNISDFSSKEKIKFDDQVELDKWIIIKAHKLQEKVLNLYNSYAYHKAIQSVHNFCVNELGGIYLDIVKDRLYTSKTDSLARRSCQSSLEELLNILIRLIAPILSYTAEEIWQSSSSLNNQEESVFLSNYTSNKNKNNSNINEQEWERLFEIKDLVNQSIEQSRNENKLKGSLDAVVNIEADNIDLPILEN
jgi:isoleucyl-tRNA synthetase